MAYEACAALIAVVLLVAAPGVLAQTIVSEFASSANTDLGVWFENDVRPGGAADIVDLSGLGGDLEMNQPAGVAAALLTTDFTNAAKSEVGVIGNYGSPDDIFSSFSLSYAFYKAGNSGQNAFAAASVKLTFSNPVCDDVASAGDCFIQLVYEPYLNGPVPTLDTWTAVNINENTGLFWATGGFGTGNSAGGPPLNTLADWRATLSSDFGDSTLLLVSIGVGSFNQGQIAYFDQVNISHSFGAGINESYDFDLATIAVPAPALAVPIPSIWVILLSSMLLWVGTRRHQRVTAMALRLL